jgi:hypothetical protein
MVLDPATHLVDHAVGEPAHVKGSATRVAFGVIISNTFL